MTITVQRGDTLSGIASRTGVSLQELLRANPQIRNPNLIHPGQQIQIPGTGRQTRRPFQTLALRPMGGGPPSRRDLRQIQRDYQVEEDRMVVQWRPTIGPIPVRAPIDHPPNITETEGRLLDRLGLQRGILGQMTFSDIRDQASTTAARFVSSPPSSVPNFVPADRRREWIENDGHRDAFRHAYWNALLTKEFGVRWTQQFTTAHEGLPGNPSTREAMDLSNNEVGRRIASTNPGASNEELANLVMQALRNGELVVIDSGGGLQWSDRVNTWEHGLTDGVPAPGGMPRPDGTASVL